MFPKVYEEFYEHKQQYGNVSDIPTTSFFYPLQINEELLITLDKGKDHSCETTVCIRT
ncbi:MAG: hypothetical protein KL787_04535 [Taibaiella sp.]|nr:hypothetical protein [Taibaiella sp.]